MEAASAQDTLKVSDDRVSASATLLVAAGVAGAWIAAGSSGLLAHSLRHALTCLILGVGVVTGWPSHLKEWRNWTIFAGGIAIALVMAVSPWEVINILAVVIILATLAQLRGGLDGQAIFITALAVLCFAIAHFLLCIYPSFWIVGDHIGQALGWLAGKMTGRRLSVGATFGGVDFLLLMSFLYGFWLAKTARPCVNRALYGGLAIVTAQLMYLVVLAHAEQITAALPAPVYPVEDGYMRMGAWVWQNSLRMMIPWNLPVIALLLQTLVAAMMFHLTSWRIDPLVIPIKSQPAGGKANVGEKVAHQNAKLHVFNKIGPIVTAMLLAGLTAVWTIKPDLDGKTIIAYQSDEVPWTTPKLGEAAENGYGLLADFVQSLGGKFVYSKNLSPEELAGAEVVLLLNPDARFSQERQSRLDRFITRGGAVLAASDRNTTESARKKLDEFLETSGIRFEGSFAASRIESWEQTLQVLNHPVTLGINDFRNGFGLGSCSMLHLQGAAYPLLSGRWGWSDPGTDLQNGLKSTYEAGDRLGDLAILAETDRPNGGKIVVLGDMACLSNDMLPVSYEFAGRLLGYLAQKTPAISPWRTAGVLLAAALLFFFVAAMRKASQPAATAAAFAAALIFCRFATLDDPRTMPEESEKTPRRVAIIDSSHLEAYSDKLWHPQPSVKEFNSKDWPDEGLGNFARTLARNGYLPLRIKKWSVAQLDRASLFISIAPARIYSEPEAGILRKFVESGGTLVCIVGAEESRAINPLLAKFDLLVPHSPVRPNETVREPEPIGASTLRYLKNEKDEEDSVEFFAAWEVASLAIGSEGEQFVPYLYRDDKSGEKTFVGSRRIGNGWVVVIADTYFAANENPDPARFANENPDSARKAMEANVRFWQWLLPRITHPEAIPKNKKPATSPTELPSESMPMQESGPDEG